MRINPELPEVASPELSVRAPLTPVVPAADVETVRAPLDVDTPLPDVITSDPPTALLDSPPRSVNAPPSPPLELVPL